jgi:hypothetical protein
LSDAVTLKVERIPVSFALDAYYFSDPYQDHAKAAFLVIEQLTAAKEEIAALTRERDALRAALEKISVITIFAWDTVEEAEKAIHSGPFWESKADESARIACAVLTKLESGGLRL